MKMPLSITLSAFLIGLLASPTIGSEVNSSWTRLGQAKVQQKMHSGTLAFRPDLSLEENNSLIEAYRSNSVSVVVTADSGIRADWRIVGRPVQFRSEGEVFRGRITAVVISPDQTATVFAQLQSINRAEKEKLNDGKLGELSIGE
jgi:hypothetical protein